jgi:hypothetical protein
MPPSPLPLDDFCDNSDTDENVVLNMPIKTKPKLKPPPQVTNFREGVPSYKKKSEINYEEILTSMNLCVKDGKLQKINNAKKVYWIDDNSDGEHSNSNKESQYNPSSSSFKSQETEIERKTTLFKRSLWIQKLQQEAQKKRIEEIKKIKTKKLNFINMNDITLVEGPKADLNKKFEILGLGKTVSVVPQHIIPSDEFVPAPVAFTPR